MQIRIVKDKRICAVVTILLFLFALALSVETVNAEVDPGKVTSLKLTVSGQPKAVLEWNETKGDANGYTILRDNKAIVRLHGKNVTSYVDESLKPGNSYSYAVAPHYKDDSGNVTLGEPSPSEKILNGYTYQIESDGTGTLTGFTGRGETTTPANIDEVNITRIGDSCFRGNVWLDEVIVSDGVVSIDDYAFEACSIMSKATLPDSITTIGDGAFNGCTQMKNCEIPAGITKIGRGAFLYCGKLTKVNLPENLESIGKFAFAGCENLTDVTFKGDNLTEIPDRAFYKCIKLGAIVLPDSIKRIGKRAFSGCEKLENCDYPDTASLGDYVFENTPLDQAPGGDDSNSDSNSASNTDSSSTDPKPMELKTHSYESLADGGMFDASKFNSYHSIQDRYYQWIKEYYKYNKDNFPVYPRAFPYIYMYMGADHYRQMTSAINGDAYKTEQSIIMSGDDYVEMYLMIDHGLFAELSRGRMPEDLLLYSGITPERVSAFAGRYEKISGAITDELRGQIIDRIGEVYEEPAMMSTTGSMRIAFDYSDGDYGSKTVVMIYASKEAINELGSIAIERIGMCAGNEEILLNGNARHRILDVGIVKETITEIDPDTLKIIDRREGESRTYIKIELLGGQEGSPEIVKEEVAPSEEEDPIAVTPTKPKDVPRTEIKRPKGTKIKSLKRGRGSVTVRWNKQAAKVSGKRIAGYQLQLATNKKFTKNKKSVTVKNYKTVKKKISGLKKGKKYYVKIRTYRIDNGKKIYSPWSKVKTIKTKK